MATATLPTAKGPQFPENLGVELLSQQRQMAPGKYHLPIGVAHEYIQRGVAKPLPEFAGIYKTFEASAKESAKHGPAEFGAFIKKQEEESKARVARERPNPNRGMNEPL